jgi:rhamnosyltransferase
LLKSVPLDRHYPSLSAEILSVIVCYHPDVEAVVALARGLLATGISDVLFIDNTESDEVSTGLRRASAHLQVDVISRGMNLGVAQAHNLGIRAAQRRGHRAVLLLDQDTQFGEDTLRELLRAYQALRARGEPIAAVGAAFIDPRNGYSYPFVRLGRIRMKAIIGNADAEPTECGLLISSGCLIPLAAIDAIGEMDESLFIDYVDFDWCTRAIAYGWKVFGVPSARMQHTIGVRSLRIFGRMVAVHDPQRQYYLIRNALLFARKPHLSFRWRLHLAYRLSAQLAMFALLCPPRLTRLRWMARGLWDGIRGRGGRQGSRPEALAAAAELAEDCEPQHSALLK